MAINKVNRHVMASFNFLILFTTGFQLLLIMKPWKRCLDLSEVYKLLLIIDAGNLENNRKLRHVCLDNAHVPLWLAREDSLEVLFLVQHYTNLLSWKPCCSVFEPLYWTTSTSNNSRKINFVLPYVAITYTVHHWEWYGLDDVILEIVLCIVQH